LSRERESERERRKRHQEQQQKQLSWSPKFSIKRRMKILFMLFDTEECRIKKLFFSKKWFFSSFFSLLPQYNLLKTILMWCVVVVVIFLLEGIQWTIRSVCKERDDAFSNVLCAFFNVFPFSRIFFKNEKTDGCQMITSRNIF
jgi:hypothetical protein